MKTCEVCGKEFEAKRSTARFCSGACKLKFNRGQSETPKETQAAQVIKGEEETREQWLARRVKETGSSGSTKVKTGNPAGSGPDIEIPIKWELSDIDTALAFEGLSYEG